MKKTNIFFVLFWIIAMSLSGVASAQHQFCLGDSLNQVATCIKALPDSSGTIIGGYTYNMDPVTHAIINSDMILMKVNPAGNSIIWQKRFGMPDANNLIQNMIITHDGNIVIVGTMGRTDLYADNVAAIMKFKASNGALMWNSSLHDPNHDNGGEAFFGVTELGRAGRYDLVAVGSHDLRPHFNKSMICVFKANGAFKYEEEYMVPWGGDGSSDNYYGICTGANGKTVYMTGIFRGDFADVRVDYYEPSTGPASGTMIWSRSFNYALPGVVLDPKGGVGPGSLYLQDNFFVNIYLHKKKLIIQGGSLHNFTTTGGEGESICRMNADGTGSAELWQIQNSGLNYANSSKIVLVNEDRLFNVQMPSNAYVDPLISLTGTSTSSVITEITSLTGTVPGHSDINTPVKFTTPSGGVHSLNDITFNTKGHLELAGSTDDPSNFGKNDIYYVKTPRKLPLYDCNVKDKGGCIPVRIDPVHPVYVRGHFDPEFIKIKPRPLHFKIKELCAAVGPCYKDADVDLTSVTDADGNCVFTALAHVTTANTVKGYEWTLPDGTVVPIFTSATTSTQTFTVPAGTSGTVKVRILIVRDNWAAGDGPCCEASIEKEVSCGGGQNPCLIEPTLTAVTVEGTSTVVATGPGGLGVAPEGMPSDSTSGVISAGIPCNFLCTATASVPAGSTITGYQWQVGTVVYPVTMSNTMVVTLPSLTSQIVTVTIFVVNDKGERCTVVLTITLDCNNGRGSSSRAGAGDATTRSESDPADEVILFPNPTSGAITITSKIMEISDVKVMDMNGKQLMSKEFDNVKTAEISLSDLAPGTYLIKVNNTTKLATKIK